MSRTQREIAIVPRPMSLKRLPGEFALSAETRILIGEGADGAKAIAEWFAGKLAQATGFPIQTRQTADAKPPAGAILLTAAGADPSLGEEGYQLTVAKNGVVLRAAYPAGFARGLQTIRQMLPPEIEGGEKADGAAPWKIPCARIEDRPRFAWRGLLLDCGRMFFGVDFVKRLIDLLAYYKMNVLHWHLTEDQGWRIEIKKYPKLTEHGAWRGMNERKFGGFYTQEQIRDVVAHAAARHVLVVPEIEMPGHAMAALACYPELSCTGGPFSVETIWGIANDVFCAGNDNVFRFLENVLIEVLDLFPSPYIHIGADECPKTRWKQCPKCQARIKAEGLKDEFELQRYFVERMARFLNQKGRQVIGWDEIMEGDPSTDAVIVQAWRARFDPALKAAQKGYRAINSSNTSSYINFSVHDLDLRGLYDFDVVPADLSPSEAQRVMGGECCLWTEFVSPRWVDGQIFPRLLGTAENLWAPAEGRDFDAFYGRVKASCERLGRMGVRYGAALACGREPGA